MHTRPDLSGAFVYRRRHVRNIGAVGISLRNYRR